MHRATRNVVLAVATLAGFAATFAATGIVVAIKELEEEFHLSPVVMTWLPLTYVLASGAIIMAVGRLADIIGRMKAFALGLTGFAVLNLASGFATSGTWLIILRTLAGLAGSFLFATNITLATLSHPPEQRGRALGILTAGVYLGGTTGPFLGGLLVHHLTWRSLFFFVGGITLLTLLMTLWALRRVEWKEPRQGPFDRLGATIWAVALPALLMGFTFLPRLVGVLLVVGGALALTFFLWWETRAIDPVLNVNLIRRNRVFAFSNAAALINYSATYAILFLVSLYLEYIQGFDERISGYVLVSMPLMQTIVAIFAGRLADRVQPRLVAASGQAICVLGIGAFAFLTENSPLWRVILILSFLGAGFGLFASPLAHIVMGSVEKRDLGMASATLATMRVSGQGVSVGISGLAIALLVGQKPKLLPTDYPNLLISLRVSFAIFTVLCALGLVAVLLSRTRRGSDDAAAFRSATE